MVEFEWDEAKSAACARTRRFNFDYAAFAFFDPNRIVEPDMRQDYGEDRFRLYGWIEGRLYLVVYTQRKSIIRIISARKANQRETRHYANSSKTY
jgi:uncharacterized DUF497 family protein